MGALGALGGLRPTGLAAVDAVLLGVGGAVIAAASAEARSVPLYLAAAAPTLLQSEPLPRLLGLAAMGCVLVRHSPWAGVRIAALGGGLAWAASVGAPNEPGPRPIAAPMLAVGVVLLSARRSGTATFRRWFDPLAIAVAALVVVGGGVATMAGLTARDDITTGVFLLEAGLDSARAGDTAAAVQHLEHAQRVLERADDRVGAPWVRPAQLVPGVSQNLRALERVVDEVRALTEVGVAAAEEADVDTLRARAGKLDLGAVEAMEQPFARVLVQLEHAEAEVDGVADQWLVGPVRDRVDRAQDEIARALPAARLALETVQLAPELLGADGPRTYLVLFTTPVEARATTGFPGNFAELTFDAGAFRMTRFGRAEDIDAGLPQGGGTLRGVDEYLQRYGRFGPTREWRNVPMSPDFPTVAFVAAQLYSQSGGRPVDGVLSLDPTALAALLTITGPIQVPDVPTPITADNAVRYLELDQYVQLQADNAQRVDVLEQLSRLVMHELTTTDLPGPRELGALLGPVADGKHLQLTTFDDAGEDLFDRIGVSGRMPAVIGDSVGVTTSNAAGNKIDVFLQRSLSYNATWDPDTGELTATATITLRNTAPTRGLPFYVIGNLRGLRPLEDDLPPGWNGSFVTLYSPWDPTEATLDGQAIALERATELGRHALSTFVQIPPGGTRTLVVQLAGVLPRASYLLDLVAQPLVLPEATTVTVRLAGGGPLSPMGPLRLDGDQATGTFPLVSDLRVGVAPE